MQPEYFVYCRVDKSTFREPEPCELKGSSTVLRGQGRSNPPALPDKQKTMSKYGDIQYLIDRPEPSEIFLRARNMAGVQLQEQFSSNNQNSVNSSYEGFKWIKAELTYPSFDNLTFAFKNSIFSVVIELIDEKGSSLTKQQKDRLLKACIENNLIPCTFKFKFREKNDNFLGRLMGNKDQLDYELSAIEQGWNLYDARTNQKINPLNLASDKKTKMSKWELSNFAIQIVRNDIEKEGNQILSFCDLPEVNPQIWFKNKKGETGWVIVKHIESESDLDYKEWVGLENRSPQLKPYDGFFASVQFYSLDTNSTKDLNRGDAMNVNYKGLERIYVS